MAANFCQKFSGDTHNTDDMTRILNSSICFQEKSKFSGYLHYFFIEFQKIDPMRRKNETKIDKDTV